MLRSLGSTLSTTRPPIEMWPSVCVSSPAMMRSSVDLPQPDGPSSTMNSPSAIVQSTLWITATSPKVFLIPSILTSAIASLLRVDQALDEPALHQHDHGDRRDHSHHPRRHADLPLGERVGGDDHLLDADHDRLHVARGGDQQRPEVLVPAV